MYRGVFSKKIESKGKLKCVISPSLDINDLVLMNLNQYLLRVEINKTMDL